MFIKKLVVGIIVIFGFDYYNKERGIIWVIN